MISSDGHSGLLPGKYAEQMTILLSLPFSLYVRIAKTKTSQWKVEKNCARKREKSVRDLWKFVMFHQISDT